MIPTPAVTDRPEAVHDVFIACDLTVLAGGPGVEREVSVESGRMVAEALERLGHRVTLRDIGPHDLSALDIPADMVFIALHGEFGEDGTIQTILDDRRIPYAGSGPDASRTAMDKIAAKQRMIREGVNTPRFEVFPSTGAPLELPPPVVVKPHASGSSVDTHIVRETGDVRRCAREVADRYGRALIEEYVRGPELTVGILDGRALPVCEIRTSREFYDYQAKYVDDDTEYRFDIDLPQALLKRVQRDSELLSNSFGCLDFCRVDWMVDEKTLTPYAIELNTIPGFTSHSLLPKAAALTGIGFDQLCGRIVESAMRRAIDR